MANTVEIPAEDAREARRRKAREVELHSLLKEAWDAADRIITRHGYQPENDRAIERFRCARDVAVLLGGESLRSFARCVLTLDRFEARLHYDTSPLSVCWSGKGMFGGMIFHPSAREWSIHT